VVVAVVDDVVFVVVVVVLSLPLSPPPQPTANTRTAAPPNVANAVLAGLFMSALIPAMGVGKTTATPQRLSGTVVRSKKQAISWPAA
jgi:hypothetical protein